MTEPDVPSAYVRDKRTAPPSREELRARIPGWGADLDPADRPSHPKLQYPADTGAHWHFPDRQPGSAGRERSIEHAFVTPVFGTAQPLHGLSGSIRRLAYDRFGEGRLAHWLLLIAGDRVDAWESHLRSLVTGHPDQPVTETGVRTERTHGGLRSRTGRSDRRHQVLDPVLVAGPWVAGAGAGALAVRRLARLLRR
ncbi:MULTISPECIES: hypothetical protein [unclassified Modestobacter]|uniref:hypothetical protein n=1 Tax=unclassified Modestobacter TaxID=2643866 RepID=UPI0022AAAC4A|nr:MULTISPECIES: hypothetical protein [unclassified Modestobacter]MCZ2826321.1 hypothetical protein [Modestobacter sp. VKM Ac-2981]MCZ2852614.1 hypothetical protein [Modestobacter sp. VKM Ac-2982]